MQSSEQAPSVKVFISYAHDDLDLCKKLEQHLSPLRRSGKITIWKDQEITGGGNWEDQISAGLEDADVILLLVSSSFFHSEYCWDKELPVALERHQAGAARAIPVILKPAIWRDTPLGQLQALPRGGKPVTQWDDLEAAFEDVALGIRDVVTKLRGLKREIVLPTEPQRNQRESHSLPFDHTLCIDSSLADINIKALTSFSQKKRVQKRLGIRSNMTNPELLGHFNLLREELLTYGAALCFGKNPSTWIVGAFTRCTFWKGNNRHAGWVEDQFLDGCLLEQYESSIDFLRRNLCLSRVISTEGSVEEWEIPLVVLREALANALIHREYTNQENGVLVEIFDDRIEINSPGGLPASLTIPQLGRKRRYPVRNPQIARIFYHCNYVEIYGTGISRMQKEMRAAQLPPPQFANDEGTFNVILRRPQRARLRETTVPASSTLVGKVNRKSVYRLFYIIMVAILVTIFFLSGSSVPSTIGIGVINEPHNEQIGLSDGSYTFDTRNRSDATLKAQAAARFAQGDQVGAASLWNWAAGKNGIDTSDAEALIYLEDQRVLASGAPYITLVVATTLTGSQTEINSGRDDLQGAYVAQKEYNDGRKLSGGRLVRLLIANAGSKADYVAEVAGQIVQAAKQDSTIVGVMGWSLSAYAEKAIPLLTQAHIPMVSSTASADSLSGASPYFFRVAPPNKSQAIAGAKYAEQQLHASHVALFVDPKNPYSNSLAADFQQQFVADGNQIVDTENYTVGDQASLPAHLQSALHSNPDLIYFAGYANDVSVLLVDLPPSLPNLQVLGGDGLYLPNAYPSNARPGFSRLRFTAFAYPDEWSILGMKDPQPFFSEYSAAFNPASADHAGNPYGFTRADYGVIFAYDAMHTLLQGCQNALDIQITLIPVTLQQGLTRITGAKAIQGVGGQISFGSNGDPMDKAVVVLYVNQDGYIQMVGVQGCFVLGKCG